MTLQRQPLRKWQEEAYEAWERAGRHGIVAAVTGSGKTSFALHCLDAYRRSVADSTAVIVVPTTALLEQWLEELVVYFDIPLSHVAILDSRVRIRPSRINLGVINTVSRVAQMPSAGSCFLIVDECHRAASNVFRAIFSLRTDATLGLSATPDRQYDSGLADVLIPNLGAVIYNYTYKEALADGVIVPFSLKNIVFDFEPEELQQYDKITRSLGIAIQKFGIESPEALRLMLRRTRISNLSLARIRIAAMLVARNPGRRILLFHEDISACDLLHRVLRENGVSAGVYHSKIPLTARVECLANYRRGDIDVLVTCRALDEGFNVPETEIGIVAAATATYRQRIQRLGRVLRPAVGKQNAIVYSIVASTPEIRRLAEEASDLEGIAEVSWTRA
jgi:superfamily II DNA or RNA helicase